MRRGVDLFWSHAGWYLGCIRLTCWYKETIKDVSKWVLSGFGSGEARTRTEWAKFLDWVVITDGVLLLCAQVYTAMEEYWPEISNLRVESTSSLSCHEQKHSGRTLVFIFSPPVPHKRAPVRTSSKTNKFLWGCFHGFVFLRILDTYTISAQLDWLSFYW